MSELIIKTREANLVDEAALCEQGVPSFIARLWAARGVRSSEEMQISWQSLLAPEQLKGIQEGASLLADAVIQQRPILIVADYDCDGATACAVGLRGLRMMGAVVDFLVPNRFDTGYGLTPELIQIIQNTIYPQPALLVTVDNGIASVDAVAAANQAGMTVLVTDHHLPADTLPDAAAIINPNQPNCPFPSKHLAGVGVIFYTLMALRRCLRERGYFADRPEPRLDSLADLVALGTVADVVKLDSNNRILVAQGLARIRAGMAQTGILALFQVAGADPSHASAMDLGFKIGPRINAAGRLADMSIGIRCLISDDPNEALALASQLDQWNKDRRQIETQMNEQAVAAIEDEHFTLAHSVCVYHPEWHQGVVGIVASRLKEKYYKPTLAFAPADPGEIRGSGRSVPDVHLRDALDIVYKRNPGMIIKFGGHAMAAGLTLRESHFEAFCQAFDQAVVEISGKTQFLPLVLTDGSLPTQACNPEIAVYLSQQVWGAGFAPPLFQDHFQIEQQTVLKDKHLRLTLRRDGKRFQGIWFNHCSLLPPACDLVYELVPNYWNGQVSAQLMIRHQVPEVVN